MVWLGQVVQEIRTGRGPVPGGRGGGPEGQERSLVGFFLFILAH